MVDELRSEYHRRLAEIDTSLYRMIVLTEEAIAAASAALLGSDDDATAAVSARRFEIKELHGSIESVVFQQLACQAPVASELRFLIAVLRIIPEVELTAALAGDISRRCGMHFTAELSPRIRGLVTQLFDRSLGMWRHAADAYSDRSPDVLDRLEGEDEVVDELYASLSAELASGVLRAPVLVEMALVARFLERLGDHAVEVGRWIESYTSGQDAG